MSLVARVVGPWVLGGVFRVAGLAAIFAAPPAVAHPAAFTRPAAFEVVVLGASGGLDESDLSCVLVSPAGRDEYIALDAGTVYSGLVRAARRKTLTASPAELLRHHLHAYFISHAHLDHIAGLVIISPEDTPKPLYGLASTLDALREHVFNGRIWPNFTDEGPGALGRYHLARLSPDTAVTVAPAGLSVEAFPLSHGRNTDSTAFLVQGDEGAALYLGDTGPDAVEGTDRLAALWRRVAPLVRTRRLRVIFLEASYPDPRPDAELFGHLTPAWILRELSALAALVDPAAPETALRGLSLVVTHIKPRLTGGQDVRAQIRRQLAPLGPRGVRVVVPRSGERLRF